MLRRPIETTAFTRHKLRPTSSLDPFPASQVALVSFPASPDEFQEYTDESEWWGAGAQVTWQVLDQNKQPMNVAGMIPWEYDQGGNKTYIGPVLGPGLGTDANGQYTDTPVGIINPGPISGGSFTQEQYIIYKDHFYPVGTVTWTVNVNSFSKNTIVTGTNAAGEQVVNVYYSPSKPKP